MAETLRRTKYPRWLTSLIEGLQSTYRTNCLCCWGFRRLTSRSSSSQPRTTYTPATTYTLATMLNNQHHCLTPTRRTPATSCAWVAPPIPASLVWGVSSGYCRAPPKLSQTNLEPLVKPLEGSTPSDPPTKIRVQRPCAVSRRLWWPTLCVETLPRSPNGLLRRPYHVRTKCRLSPPRQ